MMTRSERWNPLVISSRSVVVRGQSGDALSALQQSIDRAKRFADDLLHAHEAAANALLGELEDGGFGVAEHLFRGVALFGGPRDRRIGGMNQARAAAPCRARS